jgi:hypothetical protein
MNCFVQKNIVADFLSCKKAKDQGIHGRILMIETNKDHYTKIHLPGTDEFKISESLLLDAEKTLGQFKDMVSDFFKTPLPLVKGTRNELNPKPIKFEEDAIAPWINYSNEFGPKWEKGGCFENVQCAKRFMEHGSRLAINLAATEDGLDLVNIKKGFLDAAIIIVEFFMEEAKRIFDKQTIDIATSEAIKLIEWLQGETRTNDEIKKNKPKTWDCEFITPSDVIERTRIAMNPITDFPLTKGEKRSDRINHLFSILVEHNWMEEVADVKILTSSNYTLKNPKRYKTCSNVSLS